MDRYPRSNGSIVERANSGIQAYMAQVYGWMTCGLLLTAVVAWYAANTPAVMNFIFSSQITFFRADYCSVRSGICYFWHG